jgi:transposase
MARKKSLNSFEKGQIVALKSQGMSNRYIARHLKRSHNVINNFINLKEEYGKKKQSGRPSKLTLRERRSIIREVSTNKSTLGKLSRRPDIAVHKSTLSRIINKETYLVYKKRKSSPHLRPIHKIKRLSWARKMMSWTEEWKDIIWSDEKNVTWMALTVGNIIGMI